MKRETRREPVALVCIALILLVAAIYWPAARFGFVNLDDNNYVYANQPVLDGFSFSGLKWAFTTSQGTLWQPLVWISYMIDTEIGHGRAGAYHVANILLHTANVVILFLLLRSLTGGFWASAVASALFAAHPMRVESVAWVTERKDVLSGLFFLLTIACYVDWTRRRGPWRYALVAISLACALMSKAVTVTLPVLLLLLDYWPLGRFESRDGRARRPWRALIVEKLPLFALAAGAAVVTMLINRATQGASWQGVIPPAERLAKTVVAYALSLRTTVWPAGLCPVYPYLRGSIQPAEWIAAGAVLTAVTAAAFAARRGMPFILFGWLWYLVSMAPASGIVQAGVQVVTADRFTYLPHIGLFVAVVWLVRGAWPRRAVAALAVASIALVGCWAVASRVQVGCWRDSLTLGRRTLAVTRDNAVMEVNLAKALQERNRPGDQREAVRHYMIALKLYPKYADALANLSWALFVTGKSDEGLQRAAAALRIDPNHVDALNFYGIIQADKGNYDEAIRYLARAARLDPKHYTVNLRKAISLRDKARHRGASRLRGG